MDGLSLTNDFVFKYVFGREENAPILLSFVNAVLEDSGFRPIASVSIKDPINHRRADYAKESVLDVRAVDEHNRQYDIEVQVSDDPSFVNRSLYYWSQLYGNQLNKGAEYDALNPVICINLLTFSRFTGLAEAHNCFMIKHITNSEIVLTEDLTIHYIELNKPPEGESALGLWHRLLAGAGKEDSEMTVLITRDDMVAKAYEQYKHVSEDEDLRARALSREKFLRDQRSSLKAARQEGIQEGKQEERQANARVMRAKGYEDSEIAEITGLSLEEIQAL